MAKLSLVPKSTFKKIVPIPLPGSDPVNVEFEFKHRTRTQLNKLINSVAELATIDVIKDICVGWELDDEFNDENIEILLNNYMGAPLAIYETYLGELLGGADSGVV